MNIYLCGSHSTGKTTTAKEISKIDSSFNMLPSVARACPFEQKTPESQRFIMDKVFRRCSSYDSVIHERTPVDVFSYTQLFNLSSEYAHQRMKVDAFFRNLEYTNTPIFYFPPTIGYTPDAHRPSKHDQYDVDRYISRQLDNHQRLVYTVPTDSAENRAQYILERLESHATI